MLRRDVQTTALQVTLYWAAFGRQRSKDICADRATLAAESAPASATRNTGAAMMPRRKAVRMADRIVKLTAAIVALFFGATAVLAQDRLTKEDLVTLAVTLGVYDNRCEKLPPRLLADLQRMVRMLDKAEV